MLFEPSVFLILLGYRIMYGTTDLKCQLDTMDKEKRGSENFGITSPGFCYNL